MNLIEKLGLEKCKQIVENHATCYMPRIFKYWSESLNDYVLAEKYATASVEAIRTAIANHECDHDWEDISCNGDLERQLICTYCSMKKSEPFALNVKRWSEEDTDHCTDIRNHVSPNTKVSER